MCNLERKLALYTCIFKSVGKRLSLICKFHVLTALGESGAHVLFHSLLELSESIGSIMEIHYGFVEHGCREILEKILEITEGNCALIELLGLLYLVKAEAVGDEIYKTPILSLIVALACGAVLCSDSGESLSLGITATCSYHGCKIVSNRNKILHKLMGIFKYVLINALEYVLSLAVLVFKN